MHCVKKITDDLTWVGANDRRLAMFEGVYSVPGGVSYNSYLLNDEKTVLFDTVDKAVRQRFTENVAHELNGRELDYLVVQHMEPDHSAAILELAGLYPTMKIVCNQKTFDLMRQFYGFDAGKRVWIAGEGDTLDTGRHSLSFIMAPMVHWPEVMVTYDSKDKILFSADAFGVFGALNGAVFADEVDFEKDYMDEARRYYTNIVGKYGVQAGALLDKASCLEINMICPLHGFVWRKNISEFISKYSLWSSYSPEEYGVMIAYASVYGNTENAAEILACRLRDLGIKTVMYDVSVTPASDIVSAAFRWSHLVFASATYNAGIFVTMEALIFDLAAHNIQNRTVGIIENGSWAPSSGSLIRAELEKCKDIRFIETSISITSSLKPDQLREIDGMAKAIAETFPNYAQNTENINRTAHAGNDAIDRSAMFTLSYGLFVLTARDGGKDNGCIINTAAQITESPLRISITVNKANFTHDMILKTGEFNICVLTESASFSVFERFGFHSGKDTDKFDGYGRTERSANGIVYLPDGIGGVISGKVAESYDYGTHTLFTADVTEAFILSAEPSATYQYYFNHIKPKPKAPKDNKEGFVCKICGYVHEGSSLPDGFVCPWCKHGAEDFEKI